MESTDFEIGSIDRHRRFINRIVASNEVWDLKSKKGWCLAPSSEQEGKSVMPFWSDRAYAQQCAREEWASYQATAISLDSFLDEWLPGIAADALLAGTNWKSKLIGIELPPLD